MFENKVLFDVLNGVESKAIKTLSELIMSYKQAIVNYRDMYLDERKIYRDTCKKLENHQQILMKVMDWATVALIKSKEDKPVEWMALYEMLNKYNEMKKVDEHV